MPRVPVPDDYPKRHIVVAGTADYHYPEADVQVEDREARTLQVREDEDGRYCGPPRQYVDAVADYLGVTVPDETKSGDGEICGAELSQGGTCDRPADECPYHGGDD